VAADALIGFLDTSARRGVIPGDRKVQGRTVTKFKLFLYKPFPKGGLPDHNTPFEVLYGSGHYFTGRSGTSIDEYRQCARVKLSGCRRIVVRSHVMRSFRVHNELLVIQELTGKCRSCSEVT